jgi:DNA-binding transcriptional MocR family regulator
MPGLRLGFMIVPKALNQSVMNAKEATDISTSGLIQKAFDVYLRKGHWHKQLSHMKKIYFNRYQIMLEMLEKYLPRGVNYYVPKGGILFWIELPKGRDSRDFFEYVGQRKIAIVPGDLFYYSDIKSNAFRLSIAAVSDKEIENGIRLLGESLSAYLSQQKQQTLPIL